MEEDQIRTEATIQHTFSKISKVEENQDYCSKEVLTGEVLWKFGIKKVFNFLCVFIRCRKKKNFGHSWSCYAVCKISIINKNSRATVTKQFSHEFIDQQGYGYQEFIMPWDRLLNPEEGFIENDSITIEVNVNTDPNTIDLKMKFGYLSLREIGSNNLLNCLLQILFFTEPLRKAILQIPVIPDASEKCVVLELQRIFYQMQFGTERGDATKLIASFDKKLKHNLFTENSSKFLRGLLGILDSKTRGTCMEGTIPQLFQAKKVSSISCINKVHYKINEAVCHDIQVNIEEYKNIQEALRHDIKSKELDGEKTSKDNSLKIAEGVSKFQVVPPFFLYFHLNRCHRNRCYRKKYHGRFEFSNELSLDEYVQEPDTSVPANYTLLAVLVHTGHIGGHYSLYIQSDEGSCWRKSDCHPISDCTEYEAMHANFGLRDNDKSINFAKYSSSACMLVYRRNSVPCPKIHQEMKESEIPFQLRDCLNAHSFITVNVLLEDSFKDHQGIDLFDEQKTDYRVFKMKKDATIKNLIEKFSNKLEQSAEKMRLWPFSVRSNQTFRPSLLDMENVYEKTLFDVVGNEKYWNIFLELPSEDSTSDLQQFNKMTDVLLFFKMYNPKLKKIQYCGHSYLPDNSKVRELIQILNEKAGFPQETELELYEEIGPNNVEKIANHSEYLKKVLKELVYGGIIVFEKKVEKKLSDLPTCVDYFKDLFYRVEVSFIDKNIPNDQGFKKELSRKTTYDQIIWTVANKIDADPYSLIFFQSRDETTPNNHIKSDYEGTLEDLLDFAKSKIPYTLFYKKMESNLKKVCQKKKIDCSYLSSKLKREKNFALYFEENDTLADFLETIKKYIQATEGIKGPLRLMNVNCNKVTITPKHKSSKNNEIEYIWRIEDADDLEDELLICCFKFHGEIFSTFDTPFLVKIKQGEPFGNVKERIRKKLSVSETDWKKFKVAIIHMGEVNVIDYIINFSDFILPLDQSETFEHYISIVEDLSNEVEENNDKETPNCESCKLAVVQDELKCFQCSRIFHFLCGKDAMKCCREMDSFKSDALKIAREPHEDDISLNIVPELESRNSFLQENIYFLKNEISILKNELREKDSILYREKLIPATIESLSNEDKDRITTTRREIPRNYEL